MSRARWAVSAVASLVMVGGVTLALPGSASAATWQVTPAQAWVAPDSATDAWGVLVNANSYDGSPFTTDVVHLSGTTWSTLTVPGLTQSGDPGAIAADSPTDAWVAWGGTNITHYDGSSWTTYTPAGGTVGAPTIVSPTNVWATNNQGLPTGLGLIHWDGTKWSQVTAPAPAGYTYPDIASMSASGSDVWALARATVGPNYDTEYFVARWDGTSWSLIVLPATPGDTLQPTNISADSPTDVWVGGHDNTGSFAMHYNGSTWSTFPMPAATGQVSTVNSIAARGGQAWAVGTSQNGFGAYPHAAAWHWDGSAWSSVGIPVTSDLSSAQTVSYVPGSNTVWIEAEDPSVPSQLVIVSGG